MGGRIWVDSLVGKGSTFAFAVPFEIWAGAARGTGDAGAPGPEAPLEPLRILLAEDSPDNSIITIAYLEDTPYQVDIAETGAIALEMFAAKVYDLVLMDRQMPIMDGLTATRAIRAWEKTHGRPTTPIIALTASALKGDHEKCLAAGCTGFLTKPIKQEVLLQAIKDRRPAPIPAAVPTPRPEGARKDPSLVLVYPKLEARVPAFLEHRRRDVVTMRDALSRNEFTTVERLGHSMKGAGASFGFQAITDLGAALEQEASSADAAASQTRINDLSTYLDRVDLAHSQGLPRGVVCEVRPVIRPLSRRIVLVEDDDDLRTILRELLESCGHEVMEARDGISGLGLILGQKPDVAMVDIGLPGLSGHDIARQVRDAMGQTVWLVALTGQTKDAERVAALASGFDTHLTKPVDIDMVKLMLSTSRRPIVPIA